MYSLNARDHFNCSSPPFLMTSTTKQMRPNGRGGCGSPGFSWFGVLLVIVTRMDVLSS